MRKNVIAYLKSRMEKQAKPAKPAVDAGANIVGNQAPGLKLADLEKLNTGITIKYRVHPACYERRYSFNYMPAYRHGNTFYGDKGREAVKSAGLTSSIHLAPGRLDLEDDGSITLSYGTSPSLYELESMMNEIEYRIAGILEDYSRFRAFSSI